MYKCKLIFELYNFKFMRKLYEEIFWNKIFFMESFKLRIYVRL